MQEAPPPSSPPPPPQPSQTRRHPRFEMYATVQLHAAAETVVLPARNISLGGAYLSGDGHDLGVFEVGMELEVLVFDALDEQRKPVQLVGEIVRHDGDGLALMWADSDPDIAMRVVQLLDQLQPRAGQPE
ncbi:MAG: PilZ domain-containing protein [Myxococcales bacterium]|nr:PilZ domain-containing protein [Myxococcales bacterium]